MSCPLISIFAFVALSIAAFGLGRPLLRWIGVAGIALATSLWTVSTFFFLWYWTWRLLPPAAPKET